MGSEQTAAAANPPCPEPDFAAPSGFQSPPRTLGLARPSFEPRIGDVGREVPWIVAENVASFPVALMPWAAGRFMRGPEEASSAVLEPGETFKVARFSVDAEHYRMDC